MRISSIAIVCAGNGQERERETNKLRKHSISNLFSYNSLVLYFIFTQSQEMKVIQVNIAIRNAYRLK